MKVNKFSSPRQVAYGDCRTARYLLQVRGRYKMAKECEHGKRKQSCSVCDPESVWKIYAHGAKKAHRGFTLTLDQFKAIVAKPCDWCSEQNEPRGVDRRDSRLGCYMENADPACWTCNQIKSDFDSHFLERHIEKMYRHIQKKKGTRKIEAQKAAVASAELPPITNAVETAGL